MDQFGRRKKNELCGAHGVCFFQVWYVGLLVRHLCGKVTLKKFKTINLPTKLWNKNVEIKKNYEKSVFSKNSKLYKDTKLWKY